MKMSLRNWVALCWVGSMIGCGVAQEEPKQEIFTAAPAPAPSIPATGSAARQAPGINPSTIVIIETDPPPGLVAPSAPVTCWTGGNIDGLLCRLVDGQCCSYHADQTLVGCNACDLQ